MGVGGVNHGLYVANVGKENRDKEIKTHLGEQNFFLWERKK